MTAELVEHISGVVTGNGTANFGVNTGTVNYHFGHSSARPAPVRRRNRLPMDVVRELNRVFVPGPGHDDVRQALREPGAVAVCGPPGVGRRASALVALGKAGSADAGFRELPDDSADDGLRFDADAVEEGERLLLDLTADTPPPAHRAWADLRSYRAAVVERGAYLAVLLPASMRQVAAEIGAPRVDLRRPNGREVLDRHLMAHGIRMPESHAPKLAKLLDQEPMRELAALADRVHRVRQAAEGAGTWADWLAPALDAAEAHLDRVAHQVGTLDDGRAKALLLAAAVFNLAAPEVVALGAESLLATVGYPEPEAHRLDRPDLGESLRPLNARITGRRVEFDSVTYAEAVRTHFWTTFPELRPSLLAWLDSFLRSEVAARDRVDAALRFATQSLAHDHPEDVVAIAGRWSEHGELAAAAEAALARGLEHERHGRFFRQRVYAWATHPAPPGLAAILVRLCADVIAPARPQQALTRLRHLSRHQHAVVAASATAALVDLAARDGHFARRMLYRLREDLTGPTPRQIDPAHFLAAADPERLTGTALAYPRLSERHTRALVTECWTAVLSSSPRFADPVRAWLAVGEEELLSCLADAARGRPVLVARLYAAARDWVDGATDDTEKQKRITAAALLRRASTERDTQ